LIGFLEKAKSTLLNGLHSQAQPVHKLEEELRKLRIIEKRQMDHNPDKENMPWTPQSETLNVGYVYLPYLLVFLFFFVSFYLY